MARKPIRLAILAAAERLTAAGVPSPGVDAELLAAHVMGVDRGRLALTPLVDDDVIERFEALVARREQRIPLQHITGSAVLGPIELEVGPGVFTPRPETEGLLEWALARLDAIDGHQPVVLDLCTGSGALALAIAHARPDARVHAVEIDPEALAWARVNARDRQTSGDTPIDLVQGDVTDPRLLPVLEARVDLIVANPPYIPEGAQLEPEVAEHDPALALFAGPDGLSVIRPMIANIARWLRIDGAAGIEHDDTNGDAVMELLGRRRVLGDIVEHADLAGKPRFVTVRRVATERETARHTTMEQ